MKIKVEVVGFEFDAFEKGRWALRADGVDGVLYCQNPDPWTDGRPFVGGSVEGNFRLDCGDGRVVSRSAHILRAKRSAGLEGDWILARGTFLGMCTESYLENRYDIASIIPITANLDEREPRPRFEPGQCIEFEGYLIFEMDDGTDLARPRHEAGETSR